MSTAYSIDEGARVCPLPSPFALERGGELCGAQLGYELVGPERGPLVCVLGGISAGRHVAEAALGRPAGFWSALVGGGRALDTRRVRVLGIDFLGGVGLSSGPTSSGLRGSFPRVGALDQARALDVLLEHLGEPRIDALVGASFGGSVALPFAAEFPSRIGELVVLSAAHRPDALASAWRALQREALELGAFAGDPAAGVRLARKLAFTTYRGRADWERRGAQAAEWLERRGVEFAQRFDEHSYRVLSQAIDDAHVDPARVACRTALIGFDSDLLVPIELVRELAARLAGPCDLHELRSPFGHDGFLKETVAIESILQPIVARLCAARAGSEGVAISAAGRPIESAQFARRAASPEPTGERPIESADIERGAGEEVRS